MSLTLEFGKYKCKSIEEVFEQDASYCRWMLNQDCLFEEGSPIIAYLKEKIQADDDTYIMKWGKRRNKSLKWIKENDKAYFDWLSTNEYVTNKCPSLNKDLVRLNEE